MPRGLLRLCASSLRPFSFKWCPKGQATRKGFVSARSFFPRRQPRGFSFIFCAAGWRGGEKEKIFPKRSAERLICSAKFLLKKWRRTGASLYWSGQSLSRFVHRRPPPPPTVRESDCRGLL